jgi:hypothetical protein
VDGGSRSAPLHLKSLRKLGRKDRERISAAIGWLPDGDVKRLRGPERLWRLRVGEWRVLFDRLIVAKPAEGYVVHVRFEDGLTADVDLSYLLDYGGVFEPRSAP